MISAVHRLFQHTRSFNRPFQHYLITMDFSSNNSQNTEFSNTGTIEDLIIPIAIYTFSSSNLGTSLHQLLQIHLRPTKGLLETQHPLANSFVTYYQHTYSMPVFRDMINGHEWRQEAEHYQRAARRSQTQNVHLRHALYDSRGMLVEQRERAAQDTRRAARRSFNEGYDAAMAQVQRDMALMSK